MHRIQLTSGWDFNIRNEDWEEEFKGLLSQCAASEKLKSTNIAYKFVWNITPNLNSQYKIIFIHIYQFGTGGRTQKAKACSRCLPIA